MRLYTTCSIFILLIIYTPEIYSQTLFIDTTFGNHGSVMTIVGYGNSQGDVINQAILQPDGKILCVGSSLGFISPYKFAVARYNSNGSNDSSFGYYGSFTTASTSGIDIANAVALQPDGKFIVVGSSFRIMGDFGFLTSRFNADGTYDTSFAHNGWIRDYPGPENGSIVSATCVSILPDGKIVVGGNSNFTTNYMAFTLVKYLPNGDRDISFGTNGVVRTFVDGGNQTKDYPTSMVIQPDGKIVVGGYSYNYNSQGGNTFALMRFNSDGSVDPSFGNKGSARIYMNGSSWETNSYLNSIALQQDGKIVAGGYYEDIQKKYSFAAARLNTDGSLDNTFGTNGTFTFHIKYGDGYDIAKSVAIQEDGKILLAGTTNGAFAVARLKSNGELDNYFLDYGTYWFYIWGSAQTGDGAATVLKIPGEEKILLAGQAKDQYTMSQFALARVYANLYSVNVNDQSPFAPENFELQQNYPNPFNPTTNISFNLELDGLTTLKIYNVLGKEVRTLISEKMRKGIHSVVFNASQLPSGVYFYELRSGSFVQSKKMILIK